MEGKKEHQILKETLLELLDDETNKNSKDIDSDKVETIIRLLEYIEPLKEDTEDSVEQFICEFNRMHDTNLTADIKQLQRDYKKYIFAGIILVFVLFAGIINITVKKKNA